jgi:hypothetical protein
MPPETGRKASKSGETRISPPEVSISGKKYGTERIKYDG